MSESRVVVTIEFLERYFEEKYINDPSLSIDEVCLPPTKGDTLYLAEWLEQARLYGNCLESYLNIRTIYSLSGLLSQQCCAALAGLGDSPTLEEQLAIIVLHSHELFEAACYSKTPVRQKILEFLSSLSVLCAVEPVLSIKLDFIIAQVYFLNNADEAGLIYLNLSTTRASELSKAKQAVGYEYSTSLTSSGKPGLKILKLSGAQAADIIQADQYKMGMKYLNYGECFLAKRFFSHYLSLTRKWFHNYADLQIVGGRELAKLGNLYCCLQQVQQVNNQQIKIKLLTEAKTILNSLFENYTITFGLNLNRDVDSQTTLALKRAGNELLSQVLPNRFFRQSCLRDAGSNINNKIKSYLDRFEKYLTVDQKPIVTKNSKSFSFGGVVFNNMRPVVGDDKNRVELSAAR